MLSFLITLLKFLSKVFDQLTYVEGLLEEKKSPGNKYRENVQKLNKAIADRDPRAIAAITEQLRPNKGSPDSGLPRSGSAP